MKKALIEDGKVVQIVDFEFEASSDASFIDCDNTILSGDSYEGGKFIKPYKEQRPQSSDYKQLWYCVKSQTIKYFNGEQVVEYHPPKKLKTGVK